MEWQPIETAPQDDNARFLATDGDEIYVAFNAWKDEGKWAICVEDYWHHDGLTHWMPLPGLPK